MGEIANLREQFKSINTYMYDYILKLIKRGKNPLSTF